MKVFLFYLLSLQYVGPLPMEPQIRFLMKSNFLKIRETVPSYAIDNLIGEIGGTFSMFLGICGLSIIKFLSKKHITIFEQKLSMKPLAILAMFLPFVYWSTQNILNYLDQPVTTQSNIVKVDIKDEFPELTFCITQPYFESFLASATGDFTKYRSLHEALQYALKNDININLQDVNNSAYFEPPFLDVYTKKPGINPLQRKMTKRIRF